MNIETANRLLQYRKQHHLSQEELAEKIGVSRQAVSKWERSEASPDTDNLISLAEVYGVSLDELLKGKPEDQTQQESKDETAAEPVEPEHKDETADEAGEPDRTDETADGETNYVREDRVSFKNGIHVDSKNGDRVHISYKDGVNVYSKDGDDVHVSWDGVSVKEKGKTRVYTDEDGHIMVDEELRAISKALNVNPNYKAAVLTALNIAEKLMDNNDMTLKLQTENYQLDNDVKHYIQLWEQCKKQVTDLKDKMSTEIDRQTQNTEDQKKLQDKLVEMENAQLVAGELDIA